jgi:short-subunit dehydrogenase
MNFENQTVWITGASSGIGEALAYHFSKAGAKIVLSSRDEARLNEIAEEIGPAQAKVLPLDITELDGFELKTKRAIEFFDGIDILVNNAGVSQRGSVEETNFSVDRQIMEVNFFGNIFLSKQILPHFLEKGSGRIVVVSSIAGKLAPPFRSAYAASKHALHGWYDAFRAEIADKDIQIHLICPGYIRTNISVNALNHTGGKHGLMDEGQAKGLSADECASQILRAIHKNRRETFIGKEKWFLLVRNILPGFYHKMLNKRARDRRY